MSSGGVKSKQDKQTNLNSVKSDDIKKLGKPRACSKYQCMVSHSNICTIHPTNHLAKELEIHASYSSYSRVKLVKTCQWPL